MSFGCTLLSIKKYRPKMLHKKKVSLQHFAPSSTPCGFASFSSLHNCRRAWQLKKMAKIFSFSREMDCRSLCTTLKQQQEINAKNSKCRNAFSYLLFLCKKKEFQKFESCQKTLILCAPNCLLRHRKVWKKKRNVTFKKETCAFFRIGPPKSPHQT